ncbi:carbon-nitrogen hydrolase family protein [Pseudoflavonifractor phocaeensis]|uniref:carbon-nitrogen hydrolase family protein n=1 Tax=Pseudoflavonifractor phocaeensis TaxID=1870988 RepID=UPI00399D05BA
MEWMRLAMIQMNVVHNKEQNLTHARELLTQAARKGTDLAVLPEMFCCPYSNRFFRAYGEEEGGPAWSLLSRMARELRIYLVGGSMPELSGGKVYNTSYVFDREGRQIAKHRKAHLFDIDVEGGQRFRESETLTPGDQVTVFETEFGRMGLCICFDFRFQELAKAMADQGAQLILVPAAFNMTTGPAHWELLFRQRAVDNQIFTLGTAPARNETEEYVSYGNSILVDPWGTVLARAGAGEEILLSEVDFARVPSIRRQLPIRSARRPGLYRPVL